MRLRSIVIAIATLLLLLAGAAWLILKNSPEVTLTFTQAQLQEQLAPRFPTRKCVLGACVELLNPRLSLSEDSDRVEVDAAFVATLGNRAMPGTARFSGRPHYEQGSGNFYLQDVLVSQFQMTGNAPDFNEVVRVRGPGVVAAIMNQFPIYSVQSHPKYGAIAKFTLKNVRVANGQLQVVFVNPFLLFGK